MWLSVGWKLSGSAGRLYVYLYYIGEIRHGEQSDIHGRGHEDLPCLTTGVSR